MSERDPWNDPAPEGEDDVRVVLKQPMRDSGDLDITPMIDIVFLLLIFFLVASVPDYRTAVRLPKARHGTTVNPKRSVIISIFAPDGKGPGEVYLGDGRNGKPLATDAKTQDEQIRRAVEDGFNSGKPNVLIKAERMVRHREVSRVAAAASEVEGIKLFIGVMEVD